MKKTIMIVFSILAIVSILIVGCKVPETAGSTALSPEISEEEQEVAGELEDLDALEELGSELDDLDWDGAEEAVR